MRPLQAILLPIDFSAAGAAMAPVAAGIARRFGARVTVLHVFDLAPDYAAPPHPRSHHAAAVEAPPYTAELLEIRGERHRQLLAFTGTHFADVPHTAIIADGNPATVIEWAAREEHSDLIAMATSGHGKFRHLALGSVTARLLHDTRVPVLTTAHASTPPHGAFHSVVCAVETNREARNILDAGCLFAQTYGARLCVVHVEAAPSTETALGRVREIMSRYGDVGASAMIRVLDSAVPRGVHQAALDRDADLLVVGRGHESDGLSRLWSPLYTLIRESPCPVLAV